LIRFGTVRLKWKTGLREKHIRVAYKPYVRIRTKYSSMLKKILPCPFHAYICPYATSLEAPIQPKCHTLAYQGRRSHRGNCPVWGQHGGNKLPFLPELHKFVRYSKELESTGCPKKNVPYHILWYYIVTCNRIFNYQ
jgi:hypothetical protein